MVNFGRSIQSSGQKYSTVLLLFIQLFGFSRMSNSPILPLITLFTNTVVWRRGLMDRASASYPCSSKGLGFNPPWGQKLYICNLYLLLKYRLEMVINELSLGEPTF